MKKPKMPSERFFKDEDNALALSMQKETNVTEGKKYDEGKLRFDLIPPIDLRALAQVYTYGAETKYEDNSWQNLENFYPRYLAALHRHLNAHQLGEIKDPESGLYHLDHALWNLVALRWKMEEDAKAAKCFTIEGTLTFDSKDM